MAVFSPKILYVSAANPLKGPGAIGMEHYLQLKEYGFEVDFLTLHKVKGYPDILYINKPYTVWSKIIKRLCKFKYGELPVSPYWFFYWTEQYPRIPVYKVLQKIKKDYDWVIIYFWGEMLSVKTIDAIYDYLKHPVMFFLSADYSCMTGGCHFTGNCVRFKTGCGCCPAFRSKDENDFTHKNVVYRLQVYKKVKPLIFGNSYMHQFFTKSYLLKDLKIIKNPPTVNTAKYYPLDKQLLRKKYRISDTTTFIIALGCQNLDDPRKGIDYLIKALEHLYKQMSKEEREQILILAAGNRFETISSQIPFNSMGLGLLPVELLVEFYSLADLFVCPSIDDAGPSMVAQSIACGTPVVGFEMGAMLDYVKGRNVGYCARLQDYMDLAKGIDTIYRMSQEQKQQQSRYCREISVREFNPQKRVQQWIDLFNQYVSK